MFKKKNENNTSALEEEESLVKRDKIFENRYDESEVDSNDLNFKIDPTIEPRSYEYTIDEKIIYVKIEEIIRYSKFAKYNELDEDNNYRKMNKSEINEVYSYIVNKLSNQPKIEIFSVICNYFDISPDKFYESLSNSFKTELITELKLRGYLNKRKSLF